MRAFAFAALATLAATTALATSASAEEMAWSSPASGCVVTQGADLVESGLAKVRFKAGKTGMAVLTCPISHVRFGAAPSTDKLGGARVHYRDSTGQSSAGAVIFRVTATSLANGLSQTLGQFSSNQSSFTGPNAAGVNLAPLGFTLDFDHFVYSMTIVMVRTSLTQTIEVSAVALRAPFQVPAAV